MYLYYYNNTQNRHVLKTRKRGTAQVPYTQTLSIYTAPFLTSELNEMIFGCMLGDGCIVHRYKNIYRFENTQSIVNRGAANQVQGLLYEHNLSTNKFGTYNLFWHKRDQCWDEVLRVRTISVRLFQPIHFMFYVPASSLPYRLGVRQSQRYIKVLNKPELDWSLFTPRALRFWISRDGSKAPGGGIDLRTEGFTIEEVDLLIHKLYEIHGIKATFRKRGNENTGSTAIGRAHM